MCCLVFLVEGVVNLGYKSFVLGRESVKGFGEVWEWIIGVWFYPDIPKEYG